jgi:hypothetical protein
VCWSIAVKEKPTVGSPYFRAFHSGPRPPHCRGFTTPLRHITFFRIPLDRWSSRRRDLCLTIHNAHKETCVQAPAGFEPAIAASEKPKTHATAIFALPICL